MPSFRALLVGTLVVVVFAAVPVAAVSRGGPDAPDATGAKRAPSSPSGRAAGTTTTRPTFLQLNTCGRDCAGSAKARATKLSAVIARRKPVAVSLNEVCHSQLTALRRALRDRDYRMHSRFVKTWTVSFGPCLDETYGNVVLTRAKPRATDRLTYVAQTSSSDKRAIVCVRTKLKQMTRVCSTHLVPGGDSYDVRDEQASEARDLVGSYAGPVVLMGDMNSVPQSNILDRLYASDDFEGGAYGTFLEADATDDGPECRCGEHTLDRSKLDYVFVDRSHFALKHANAVADKFSDHKRLWGKPRWR